LYTNRSLEVSLQLSGGSVRYCLFTNGAFAESYTNAEDFIFSTEGWYGLIGYGTNGSAFEPGNTVSLMENKEYAVQAYAVDLAGNRSSVRTYFITTHTNETAEQPPGVTSVHGDMTSFSVSAYISPGQAEYNLLTDVYGASLPDLPWCIEAIVHSAAGEVVFRKAVYGKPAASGVYVTRLRLRYDDGAVENRCRYLLLVR
jgi:hypothetical protein